MAQNNFSGEVDRPFGPLHGVVTIEDLFRPPDDGVFAELIPRLPTTPMPEAKAFEHLVSEHKAAREETLYMADAFLRRTVELVPA